MTSGEPNRLAPVVEQTTMSLHPRDSLPQAEDSPDSRDACAALFNPPTDADRDWWGQETFRLDDFGPDGPCEPTLPFPEFVAAHASWLRSLDSDPYAWLARKVDELADLARFLRAVGPDDFDAKQELQEEWKAKGGAAR